MRDRYVVRSGRKKYRPGRKMITFLFVLLILSALLITIGLYNTHKTLPDGVAFAGLEYCSGEVQFLRDLTRVDQEGVQHLDHEIFDTVISMIQGAEKFILLDFFLFNDFTGAVKGKNRQLSRELAEALIAQKKKFPDLQAIFITDPVNTVYGGLRSENIALLEQHGVEVVFTDLGRLRDSNILYSPFWRLLIAPFGQGTGSLLPNPFGAGRVSLRSYLRLLNFKANHRKLIIADKGESQQALVTSANPHDGSSSHGNVAVLFSGGAVKDLLSTERSVLSFSSDIQVDFQVPETSCRQDGPTLQIVTEGAIKNALLKELDRTGPGDRVSLVMFYLADRDIVARLREVSARGTEVRILLDPNKDAFGRRKNGIPNRQVAAELVSAGIVVRWANTHGEQLHSKIMHVDHGNGTGFIILGSANFTRRNLNNFNLESDVVIRGGRTDQVFRDTEHYIDLLWNNFAGQQFSVDYQQFADSSRVRIILYRLAEYFGLSTF